MTFVFRRWMLALIGTLCYFVSGHTLAQVVTCDGAAPGSLYGDCGAPGVANAPPAAKVPVLYCDQPASIGSPREQCPSAKWIPFDNAQAGSKLLTSYAGWQALSKITYVVVVPPPPASPSLVWTIDTTNIVQGQPVTVTWVSTDATTCTSDFGATGMSGTVQIRPPATRNISQTCSNATDTARNVTTITVKPFVVKDFECIPYPNITLLKKLDSPPQNVTTRFDKLAIWYCDFPDHIVNYYSYFTWLQVVGYIRSNVMLDEVNAAYRLAAVPLTDAEQRYAETLSTPLLVWPYVAANGTSLTRPVYARNPDGTRNTTARKERVSIKQPDATLTACNPALRLKDAAGKGTMYFSVKNWPNVATADPSDKLGDLYAQCTIP